MQKLILLTLFGVLLSCGKQVQPDKPIVAVSIAPLKYIVDQIADTTVDVLVTVPETTSPETYEMTTKQMAKVANAQIYFAIGLIDFEQQLGAKINSVAPNTTYINLAEDLPLLASKCGHEHENGHSHNHLVDPHVWLSVRLMKMIAHNITQVISDKNPDMAQMYSENLVKLYTKFDSLDASLVRKFSATSIKAFAIVHPSLTYFANDYQLQQISIEQDGKEPSVLKTKQVIDSISAKKIKTILYSRQTPNAAAMQIAKQVGAKTVEYDPLSGDWYNNIVYLSDMICN